MGFAFFFRWWKGLMSQPNRSWNSKCFHLPNWTFGLLNWDCRFLLLVIWLIVRVESRLDESHSSLRRQPFTLLGPVSGFVHCNPRTSIWTIIITASFTVHENSFRQTQIHAKFQAEFCKWHFEFDWLDLTDISFGSTVVRGSVYTCRRTLYLN